MTSGVRVIEVRTITDDEIGGWTEAVNSGFLRPVAEGEVEYRRSYLDLTRTWAAFDGGRVVGTLRSFPTELTLPGGCVAADAVTNVTVLATHRRQGLLTRMMEADLQAAAERGDAVSILIASEFPIYGRFGYGPAVDHVGWTVDARSARLRVPPSGTVELVDAETMLVEGPPVYERVRGQQPGAIERDGRWWRTRLGLQPSPGFSMPPSWRVLCRDDGGRPVGYVRYHVEGRWDERRADSTLVVDDLVAVDPVAEARLWAYCLDVDWVATVRADDRSTDELLPWLLTDARSARQTSRADLVWLRVLDTAATLSGRRYLTGGRVVLEVVDPLGLASGRFALEGGPDGAVCATTSAEPGLTLSVATLGTVLLGGTPLARLAGAGLVDEHRPGALATADAMFRSAVAPWCATWF